jgi:hypothetical protein
LAQGQSFPVGIAIDDTSIYWGNSGDGRIMTCPLSGCVDGGTPKLIAQGQIVPYGLAVSGSDVFWVDFFGAVRKCPKTGCLDAGPYSFPASSGAGIALDSTNIYWTEFTSGRVAACPLSGCGNASVLYQGAAGPTYGIAVDSTHVYWPNNTQGRLYSAPITGVPDGGAPTLLAVSGDPNYATVSPSSIYWTVSTDPGTVQTAPLNAGLDGSVPTILAAGQRHPKAVVLDPACGTLYWASSGPLNLGGGVYRCPITGCPDSGPAAFAANQDGPVWVAVDTSYVYWADYTTGTVWKRAK